MQTAASAKPSAYSLSTNQHRLGVAVKLMLGIAADLRQNNCRFRLAGQISLTNCTHQVMFVAF
jgi:hypothetical protein